MDAVYDKLEEAALYIERNRKIVKSIASFPYIELHLPHMHGQHDSVQGDRP
jgi:hypothetical protein